LSEPYCPEIDAQAVVFFTISPTDEWLPFLLAPGVSVESSSVQFRN
jgi:hypothetical protein